MLSLKFKSWKIIDYRQINKKKNRNYYYLLKFHAYYIFEKWKQKLFEIMSASCLEIILHE